MGQVTSLSLYILKIQKNQESLTSAIKWDLGTDLYDTNKAKIDTFIDTQSSTEVRRLIADKQYRTRVYRYSLSLTNLQTWLSSSIEDMLTQLQQQDFEAYVRIQKRLQDFTNGVIDFIPPETLFPLIHSATNEQKKIFIQELCPSVTSKNYTK